MATAGFQQQHHHQVERLSHSHFAQAPRGPPSPPMDETRCSLPSISNLLGLADAGSPTSEVSPTSLHHSPRLEALPRSRPAAPYTKNVPERPRSTSQLRTLPPSPPMSTDASFDGNSPTSKPAGHFTNAPASSTYYYETTPPLESDQHRPHGSGPSLPRLTNPAPYQQPPAPQHYASTTYQGQPPRPAYYQSAPPAQSQSQVSGLYYQRPLPQSFPPPLNIPVAVTPSSGANPWQHHHYMNPSHGAAFPQSQDRYICQICSKAFSRPSSLRIHSHSHTGEKPFKCPHAGCGKAFSVRSNMKRHERGCHSFEVSSGASPLSS